VTQQQQQADDEQPMPIEPAHVMKREKHEPSAKLRRMAQEAAQQK
jgi:hypothetical protein